MTLTATQRLQVKKHMGEKPNYEFLDPFITTIEADADMEAELVACLTLCNTTLTAISTAQTGADEIIEGGGAKFSHERAIAIKRSAYNDAVDNLARILNWESPVKQGVSVGYF